MYLIFNVLCNDFSQHYNQCRNEFRPSLCSSRLRLSPQIRVWGLPASHLRPLPDEGQRLLMAWRVFAVHRVSTASHHQLLLQRKETLLQTRLPTVSTITVRRGGGSFFGSFPLFLYFFSPSFMLFLWVCWIKLLWLLWRPSEGLTSQKSIWEGRIIRKCFQ